LAQDLLKRGFMQKILLDVRYALRGLLRAPAFSAVAIGSLALGIGTNTAVFSLFSAVLLRPFPYAEPDRLAAVFETNPKNGVSRSTICPPDYLEWRDHVRAFQNAAAYRGWEPNLTGVDEPERLTGVRVTGDFFRVLGTQPVAGRVLLTEDETQRNNAVVVSYRLWKRLFAGDPQLVGRTIRLNGEGYVVAGIMPSDFQFPHRLIDIWAPLNLDRERNDRSEHSLLVVARLRADGTLQQARAELGALMASHEKENDGCGADLVALRDWYVGAGSRQTLWILLGAVGLVLLIACANVANLLLARAGGRERELMVRAAIGATRGRLIAQMVTESLLIAMLAGMLGLLLAMWSAEVLVALLPAGSVYLLSPVVIDWRVVAFTFAVSVIAGLIFGTMPAWRSSRTDYNPARAGARSAPFRLRGALLVAQTALAVMLLAGAGLLARTYIRLWQTDPGFSSDKVLAAGVSLPTNQTNERRGAFFDSVLQRLATEPRVAAVGAVTHIPLGGSGSSNYITFEGREELTANPANRPSLDRLIVTAGYFLALEIPLRQGRLFTEQDVAGAPPVVIVNEAAVRRYWPNESPIGRRIKRGTPTAPFPWLTVVGVVGDVRQISLTSRARPMVYLPLPQSPEPAMTLVVKADGDPGVIASLIRSAVRTADRDQPIAWIRSLDEIVFGSLGARWLPMLWMTVFASLALVLAAAGVYGVVSYAVERRRREFGIRMALGADRTRLIRLALRQGLLPALAGTVIGLGITAIMARRASTLLVGVTPNDVSTFLAAAGVLAVVAFAASYPPARRIANEDASLALRSE
jgi:predicted permease